MLEKRAGYDNVIIRLDRMIQGRTTVLPNE
jgi:hypothetical protein